jgi:hypothetical protein
MLFALPLARLALALPFYVEERNESSIDVSRNRSVGFMQRYSKHLEGKNTTRSYPRIAGSFAQEGARQDDGVSDAGAAEPSATAPEADASVGDAEASPAVTSYPCKPNAAFQEAKQQAEEGKFAKLQQATGLLAKLAVLGDVSAYGPEYAKISNVRFPTSYPIKRDRTTGYHCNGGQNSGGVFDCEKNCSPETGLQPETPGLVYLCRVGRDVKVAENDERFKPAENDEGCQACCETDRKDDSANFYHQAQEVLKKEFDPIKSLWWKLPEDSEVRKSGDDIRKAALNCQRGKKSAIVFMAPGWSYTTGITNTI